MTEPAIALYSRRVCNSCHAHGEHVLVQTRSPVQYRCANCGHLNEQPEADTVEAVPAEPATLERGRQERATHDHGLDSCHNCDSPPKFAPEPDCDPIAVTAAQHLAPASAALAASEAKRRGNGKTPQPFKAVEPPRVLCNALNPEHAGDFCKLIAGHFGDHVTTEFTWKPGADYSVHRRRPGAIEGPAQAAIAAITERERAELEQLRAERDVLLADFAHWEDIAASWARACRSWQHWAAALLHTLGKQPEGGELGDSEARRVLARVVMGGKGDGE